MKKPARARRAWAAIGKLAVKTTAALLATVLGIEASFRVVPHVTVVDLLRDYYKFFHVSPLTRGLCRTHGMVHAPGISWKDGALNLRLRYTTGAVALGDCVHGFRLNGERDEAPAHGVVFGDSMSDNIHLDDTEGWVSDLSRLTGKRFVNISLGGQGTSRHLRAARAYVPALRPRVIVVQLTANDASEDWAQLASPDTPGLPPPASSFDAVRRPLGRLSKRWPWRHSVLLAMFMRWGLPWLEGSKGPPAPVDMLTEEKIRLQRRNLDDFRELARRHGARLVIVGFPPKGYFERLDLDAWCRQNAITWVRIDPDRWLSEGRFNGNYGIKFDRHYNAAGNRLVAEDVFSVIGSAA